jgi:hypothetical protein
VDRNSHDDEVLPDRILADLRRRLEPLVLSNCLNVMPPRKTRFGSTLVLSRVRWVEPKLVRDHILDLDSRQPLATHGVCRLGEDEPAATVVEPIHELPDDPQTIGDEWIKSQRSALSACPFVDRARTPTMSLSTPLTPTLYRFNSARSGHFSSTSDPALNLSEHAAPIEIGGQMPQSQSPLRRTQTS